MGSWAFLSVFVTVKESSKFLTCNKLARVNRDLYFILTAIVEICSVGAGLVKIAGVETEFFLTIDDSGTLRATVSNRHLWYSFWHDFSVPRH